MCRLFTFYSYVLPEVLFMAKDYKTVSKQAKDEFVEKRSRFIGYCKPVTTEQEAIDFINEKRSEHWNATHNCYAYSLREGNIKRYSDDGEPSGTAGMPMLDVITKNEIYDVCVVVTRYFGGVLLGFLRGNEQFRRKHLNNKKLADFFNAAKKDNYEALIRSFPDLGFLKLYLGDYNNTQALGVLAEILVMVKDTFFGVFSEVGEFSVREFIRNRGGKTLFLEYDMAIGESLTPLYSLLVDLALKEAMSQNNPSVQKGKNRGRVYIVIDEFKLLPHLQHIDDAVNFGRGMGVSVMAGLQSIHQIYANYGESQGGALLSGFCSVIAFRQNDAVSRDYVRELFGRNLVNETVYSTGGGITSERRGGYVVEDWVIERLNIGEAVIGIDGKAPFIMHFDKDDRRKRGGSAWQ